MPHQQHSWPCFLQLACQHRWLAARHTPRTCVPALGLLGAAGGIGTWTQHRARWKLLPPAEASVRVEREAAQQQLGEWWLARSSAERERRSSLAAACSIALTCLGECECKQHTCKGLL